MDIINYALLKQAYTTSVDVSKFLDKYEMSKLLKGQYEFEGACIIIEAGSEGIRSEVHQSYFKQKMYLCSFSQKVMKRISEFFETDMGRTTCWNVYEMG